MFDLNQPDDFALRAAERINRISADTAQAFANGLRAGFRELWYDGDAPRPAADVQRILAAFVRPAAIFDSHFSAVQWMLANHPSLISPADFTPPIPHVVNDDGSVAVTDPEPANN